jgi:hypothetical protein
LIALGIFDFVLFPSLTSVTILEIVAMFVEYKNTQINPIVVMLAKTILIVNHCRRIGKKGNEMLHTTIILMNDQSLKQINWSSIIFGGLTKGL